MSDSPPVHRALRQEWRIVLAWGLACLAAHAGLAAASLLPAGLGEKAALLLPKVDKWLPAVGFFLLFAIRGWGTDRAEGRHLSPLLLAGLVCLAWTHRFVQDDAYITFRYARNLASGFGLVWNPGEPPLEGYTNFLWALLLTPAIAADIDPAAASMGLGILCLVATCTFTHQTALLLTDNARVANLAVFVAGTNYSFSAYATGGLETQMQTALLTGFILTCLRITRRGDCRTRDAVTLSFFALFAVLTRLDSGLILAVAVLFVLVRLHRAGVGLPGLVRRHALAVLPATLLLLLYFAWKISFYGHLLPNTFHVKAQGGGHMVQGLMYVHTFLSAYGYTLPLVVALASLVHAPAEGPPRPATIPEVTAFVSRVSEENIPRDACILEIPVDETRSFSALYLTHHPAVERHVDSGLFRVRSILSAAPSDPDGTNTTNVGKQEQHD